VDLDASENAGQVASFTSSISPEAAFDWKRVHPVARPIT
jgi:hypothetical protein